MSRESTCAAGGTCEYQTANHRWGPMKVREVILSREPVELYKVLKFEGLVASGGEARAAVAAGEVRLNGSVELQKRKKVSSGDIIEMAGQRFVLRLGQPR
jgi:ribosome-associated protein